MKTKKTWNKFSMLGLVARSLNACGSAVLFSYDTCSSSLEKVYDLSKKTSSASINLFRSPKRIISPQKTTQLIKKIKMCVHNLNNLYRKLGRRVMEATDPDHPFASEEMQSLLAEVKDFKSKVELLKERLVALEGRERANLLLKKELKAYARHSAKTAKRYGKGEPEIQEAVAHAITDAEAQVAFVSESDRITFRTVAGDLLEQDMEIKVLAAVELGRMRCGAAVNVLKEALKYDDPRLTLEIVRSLLAIGDKSALPALIDLLGDKSREVREKALAAIRDLTSEDISFEVEAQGRDLSEAMASVRKRFQEMSVSGAAAEVVHKEAPQRAEPAGEVIARPSQEGEGEEYALQNKEETAVSEKDSSEPSVKAEGEEIEGSQAIETAGTSRPSEGTSYSKEILREMLKSQLIALCKELHIECDYTEQKERIIENIFKCQQIRARSE